MNNIFPFQLVPQNSKIIIYGAGTVGKQYYAQINNTQYANLVAWVDKNYKKCRLEGLPVEYVTKIKSCKFDYIVIAIISDKIAASIRDYLKKEFSVADEKIIYYKNSYVDEQIQVESVYDSEINDEELYKVSAKSQLSHNRLDLCVRYLVAKDVQNDIRNDGNLSLYSRMILSRNEAKESKDFFNEYNREGTRQYIDAITKISKSMKLKGFDRERYIPIGDNNVFLDGSHRIAAAMALEEDIWTKHIEGVNGNVNFGMDWFSKNGFSDEDKIRILRAYADLYDKCGIIILFGTSINQWGYLEAQLKKSMTIVGAADLDFSNNYIAFENLIHEIYSDYLWQNVYIDRKLDLLMMAPLKIRVLLVSNEGFEDINFYETMCSKKLELRDRLYYDTDVAPVVMHGSDSKEEFEHLKHLLLSVNNLYHLKKRVTRNYSEKLIDSMERYKTRLKQEGINKYETFCCGSCGFEIFGLRRSGDLDIVFHSGIREEYGNDTIWNWMENIDYTRINSIQVSDGVIYPDDVIISDDNLYYMFNGLKIVNLELMAQKKAYSRHDKDLKDVRRYDLFCDYVNNFNDKEWLKKQIENNFYKKR